MKFTCADLVKLWHVVLLLCPFDALGSSPWREIHTPHFHVITDTGNKDGADLIKRLENMRSIFSTLVNNANVSDPAPLQIIALHDAKELKGVLQPSGRTSAHSGMFRAGTDESFIVLDMSSADPWHVVFHEYAHELLNANSGVDTNIWFDEGFAEYFSTVKVRKGCADVGLVPNRDLQFLRKNGKLLPLRQIFLVEPHSDIYTQSGEYQSIFYAESWLLVHYLFEHKLTSHMSVFFAAMRRTHDPQAAVVDAFGMSVEELERRLLAYGKGEQFRYFEIPFLDETQRLAGGKSLDQADIEALKADIGWHFGGSLEGAATNYRTVLKENPDNELALRGLGFLLLSKGELDIASQNLRRAVLLHPEDTIARYYLALLIQNQMNSDDRDRSAPDLIREANECIVQDPGFADCYRVLALEYASERDYERALSNMRKAITLSPRREEYVLDLADITSQAKGSKASRAGSRGPAVQFHDELE